MIFFFQVVSMIVAQSLADTAPPSTITAHKRQVCGAVSLPSSAKYTVLTLHDWIDLSAEDTVYLFNSSGTLLKSSKLNAPACGGMCFDALGSGLLWSAARERDSLFLHNVTASSSTFVSFKPYSHCADPYWVLSVGSYVFVSCEFSDVGVRVTSQDGTELQRIASIGGALFGLPPISSRRRIARAEINHYVVATETNVTGGVPFEFARYNLTTPETSCRWWPKRSRILCCQQSTCRVYFDSFQIDPTWNLTISWSNATVGISDFIVEPEQQDTILVVRYALSQVCVVDLVTGCSTIFETYPGPRSVLFGCRLDCRNCTTDYISMFPICLDDGPAATTTAPSSTTPSTQSTIPLTSTTTATPAATTELTTPAQFTILTTTSMGTLTPTTTDTRAMTASSLARSCIGYEFCNGCTNAVCKWCATDDRRIGVCLDISLNCPPQFKLEIRDHEICLSSAETSDSAYVIAVVCLAIALLLAVVALGVYIAWKRKSKRSIYDATKVLANDQILVPRAKYDGTLVAATSSVNQHPNQQYSSILAVNSSSVIESATELAKLNSAMQSAHQESNDNTK